MVNILNISADNSWNVLDITATITFPVSRFPINRSYFLSIEFATCPDLFRYFGGSWSLFLYIEGSVGISERRIVRAMQRETKVQSIPVREPVSEVLFCHFCNPDVDVYACGSSHVSGDGYMRMHTVQCGS
jgi:hypothetical protein